jgi:hypothetical protein
MSFQIKNFGLAYTEDFDGLTGEESSRGFFSTFSSDGLLSTVAKRSNSYM